MAFDLSTNKLLSRTRVPDPGLINAVSAPAVGHACSWRACDTSARHASAVHQPDMARWLPGSSSATSSHHAAGAKAHKETRHLHDMLTPQLHPPSKHSRPQIAPGTCVEN